MTDTINGRTPEEIKQAAHCVAWDESHCDDCAYRTYEDCSASAVADLLMYVQQLERERDEARNDLDTLNYANTELHSAYEAMKRERDAAVKQLRKGGRACNTCKFSEDIPENDKICEECRLTGTKLLYSNWEWAGPQEVE
jgi:hypothetical protein